MPIDPSPPPFPFGASPSPVTGQTAHNPRGNPRNVRPPWTSGEGYTGRSAAEIVKLKPMHMRVIDFMIANPHATRRVIATAFGVSTPWMSKLINSDLFQAEFARRRDEVFSLEVENNEKRLQALLGDCLDRLHEAVMDEGASPRFIRETTETALKGLGFGTSRAPAVSPVQNNVYVVSPEVLQRGREVIAAALPEPANALPDNSSK